MSQLFDFVPFQGFHQMSVMLGCPPHLHMLFDWNATKKMLYDEDVLQTPIDCLYPEDHLPCFYFENGQFLRRYKHCYLNVTLPKMTQERLLVHVSQ